MAVLATVLASLAAGVATAQTNPACPSDPSARSADTLLVVQGGTPPQQAFSAASLAALPAATLTQRLSVTSSAGAATERSISYGGVLLRELLLKADLRPGPRHVRKLCGVIVRRP